MKYQPDRAGTARLLRSPAVQQACMDAARRGKGIAERLAPRHTGTYARSFSVKPAAIRLKGDRLPRAGAILENTDSKSTLVEWGRGPDEKGRGSYGGARVLTRTLAAMRKGI